MKNISLYKSYNYSLVKNLTRLKCAFLIGVLFFISCEDVNNLMITKKEAKTENGRFELSLMIDPDIVYESSSTKLITKIKRLVPKDSLYTVGSDSVQISTEPSMYCLINSVGGSLDIHSLIYIDNQDQDNIKRWFEVSLADSLGATWEGLAFYIPSTPVKNAGHISAIFDGMNLTLPVKLVANQ